MPRPKREDRASVKDSSLTLRLTVPERNALNRLVLLRQEELGADANVSQGSYMRGLLHEAAREKGVAIEDAPPAPAASKPSTPSKHKKGGGAKR
jgi:hypothetical protein